MNKIEEIKHQMQQKIKNLGVTTGRLTIRSAQNHNIQYELCLQTKQIKLRLKKKDKNKEIIFDFNTNAIFEDQKKSNPDVLSKLSKYMKQISKDVLDKKATFELIK